MAERQALVVILDDIHRGDEPSLLVLRHLADRIAGTRLLVLAAFRDVEPASPLPEVLPDLLRSPAVDRLDLRGFELAEVREQLSATDPGHPLGRRPGRSRRDRRQPAVRAGGRPCDGRRQLATGPTAPQRA